MQHLPGFPIIAVATLGVAGICKDDTTLVTTDGTTLVDRTTWVETDEVTLDMTGKITLFETDADEVTVALEPPLLCC